MEQLKSFLVPTSVGIYTMMVRQRKRVVYYDGLFLYIFQDGLRIACSKGVGCAPLTYSVKGRHRDDGGWRTLTGMLLATMMVGGYHTNEFKVVSSSISI